MGKDGQAASRRHLHYGKGWEDGKPCPIYGSSWGRDWVLPVRGHLKHCSQGTACSDVAAFGEAHTPTHLDPMEHGHLKCYHCTSLRKPGSPGA